MNIEHIEQKIKEYQKRYPDTYQNMIVYKELVYALSQEKALLRSTDESQKILEQQKEDFYTNLENQNKDEQ